MGRECVSNVPDGRTKELLYRIRRIEGEVKLKFVDKSQNALSKVRGVWIEKCSELGSLEVEIID